jgi:hypothetical protein
MGDVGRGGGRGSGMQYNKNWKLGWGERRGGGGGGGDNRNGLSK